MTTALEQVTDQRLLIATQLEELASAGQAAYFGSERHADLAKRAVTLRQLLLELDRDIAGLQEAAKTDEARQAEAEASAKAASAMAAIQAAEDKAAIQAVIQEINQASDALAKALAKAGAIVPPVIDSLAGAGYSINGPWGSILPASWGNGRIAPLPYVITTENGAMLTSRGEAGGGRHLS